MSVSMLGLTAHLVLTAPEDLRAQDLFLAAVTGHPDPAAARDLTRAVVEKVTVFGEPLSDWALSHRDHRVRATFLANPAVPIGVVSDHVGTTRRAVVRAAMLTRAGELTEDQIRTLADPLSDPTVANAVIAQHDLMPPDLVVDAMAVLEPWGRPWHKVKPKKRIGEFTSIVVGARYAPLAVSCDRLHPVLRIAALEGLSPADLAHAAREVLPALVPSTQHESGLVPVLAVTQALRSSSLVDAADRATAEAVVAFLDGPLGWWNTQDPVRKEWAQRLTAAPVPPPDLTDLSAVKSAADLSDLWRQLAAGARTDVAAVAVLLHPVCDRTLAELVLAECPGCPGLAEVPYLPREPMPAWMLADRDLFTGAVLAAARRPSQRRSLPDRLADDRTVSGVTGVDRLRWLTHTVGELPAGSPGAEALWRWLLQAPRAPVEVLDAAPWPAVAVQVIRGMLAPGLVECLLGRLHDLFETDETSVSGAGVVALLLDSAVPTAAAFDAAHAALV